MRISFRAWVGATGLFAIVFASCPDLRAWLADAVVRLLAQPAVFVPTAPMIESAPR